MLFHLLHACFPLYHHRVHHAAFFCRLFFGMCHEPSFYRSVICLHATFFLLFVFSDKTIKSYVCEPHLGGCHVVLASSF